MKPSEKLLQFLWQQCLFNFNELFTLQGEQLWIIHPGQRNFQQGPDFLHAKIKIGKVLWVGQIEIHLKASDWFRHQHQNDPHYQNVILHVVWENDLPLKKLPSIPVIVLKGRVSLRVLHQYESLQLNKDIIPCIPFIHSANPLVITHWKDRMMIEKIHEKTGLMKKQWKEALGDWETFIWWEIAAAFGRALNTSAFTAIAKSLPIASLRKFKDQCFDLEALLFGQAKLLYAHIQDEYYLQLQQRFLQLKQRLYLQPVDENLRFFRMRPAGFPTIRLAQLARLLHHTPAFFPFLMQASLHDIQQWLSVTAGDYWNSHYHFKTKSKEYPKKTGTQFVNNIIANTIIPLLCLYHQVHQTGQIENMLQWYDYLPPEMNHITRKLQAHDLTHLSCYDSQTLLYMKKNYCDQKKCLQCAIGLHLLGRE